MSGIAAAACREEENTVDQIETKRTDDAVADDLVEDVSIDGMCGVY